MSRYILGEESTVTLTFEKKGEDTLMVLMHSDLPDDELAQAHKEGWTCFLDKLADQLGSGERVRK